MISIGSKGLKVIKPAAKAVQFWNEKSTIVSELSYNINESELQLLVSSFLCLKVTMSNL